MIPGWVLAGARSYLLIFLSSSIPRFLDSSIPRILDSSNPRFREISDSATAVTLPSITDIPLLAGIAYRTAKVVWLQNRVSIPALAQRFDARNLSDAVSRAADRADAVARLDHVRWLTDGVLHRLYGGAYCMKRSLVLYHYATRYGLSPRLVFGVAKEGDGLKGHAWIEIDGAPYREKLEEVERFRVIYSWPDRRNEGMTE